MAIYHCSIKVVSRNQGRSSVGAAAYRSGEKLYNEYDGITHDFTRKSGIVYSEILLPKNAPSQFQDRQVLWNAVEKSETRTNSRTAREIEVALPVELNRQEQLGLLKAYIQESFVSKGMCADFSIHSGHHKHDRAKEYDDADKDIKIENPHAHIMVSVREIDQNGFGKKNRNWDQRTQLLEWRKNWADLCNQEFAKKKLDVRIDHRSYKEQGLDIIPMVHLGGAAKLESRGILTNRGTINREVRMINMRYQKGLEELEKELAALKKQRLNAAQSLQQDSEIKLQGSVRNPSRNDEFETRNWQRSGGLERVEPVQAKEEELTVSKAIQDPNRTDSTVRNSSAHTRSAEEIATRMADLKAFYIRCEKEIQSQNDLANRTRSEKQQLGSTAEAMTERADNIHRLDSKISGLQEKRQQLGLFASKDKKAIDEQIQSLQKSKQQAIHTFEKEYGVRIENARDKVNDLIGKTNKLDVKAPDTAKLRDLQRDAELLFKAEKLRMELRPDQEAIKQLIRQQTSFENVNMKERMIIAQAESRLINLDRSDIKKLKSDYSDQSDIQEILSKKGIRYNTARITEHTRKVIIYGNDPTPIIDIYDASQNCISIVN